MNWGILGDGGGALHAAKDASDEDVCGGGSITIHTTAAYTEPADGSRRDKPGRSAACREELRAMGVMV